MKLLFPLFLVCAVAAGGVWADGPSARTALVFHAAFDGSAQAVSGKGAAALPVRARGLAYEEGVQGQAARFSPGAGSALAYAADGRLARERGAAAFWFKPGRTAWMPGTERRTLLAWGPASDGLWVGWRDGRLCAEAGGDVRFFRRDDVLTADWNHLAATWDEAGVRLFLNGRPAEPLGEGLPAEAAPLPRPSRGSATFGVGCRAEGEGVEPLDGLVDDLRLYSGPLSAEQVRELWRRACVVALTASRRYALENESARVDVTAESPAGCDLAHLKYCVCDAAGKPVAVYGKVAEAKMADLLVNLPAGNYEIRTTDGVWFYGAAPFTVLPKRREGRPGVAIREPRDRPPPSGLARLWHDAKAFDRTNLKKVQTRLAKEGEKVGRTRVVARDAAGSAELPPVELGVLVDRTAERMKDAGENLLVHPGGWTRGAGGMRARGFLDAWYAKFDGEGLLVMPSVDLTAPGGRPGRKAVAGLIDALAEQGVGHPSFRGVCLVLPGRAPAGFGAGNGESATDFFLCEARRLAGRRADLQLVLRVAGEGGDGWLDRARLAQAAPGVLLGGAWTPHLRDGDVLGLERTGGRRDAGAASLAFVQAFRALPAVVMGDVAVRGGVRVRQADFLGKSYFYAVNAGTSEAAVTLEVPDKTVDLVTGETRGGLLGGSQTFRLALAPGELRSYSAPAGVPAVK